MRDKLRSKRSIPALALLVTVAAVGVGFGATPAAAAPTGGPGNDYRPSAWAKASDAASAEKAPSLTDSVRQPEGGTGSQLPIGLALMGLGVLWLVYGLVKHVVKGRGLQTRPVARAVNWPRAGHPPAETRLRP